VRREVTGEALGGLCPDCVAALALANDLNLAKPRPFRFL
jgi:hypothetical protein